MDSSPNLTLPYIIAAQAQKHVTHNEALRGLDALVQLMVLDKDLSSPPGSPSDGDRYIVAASPTGAWSGHAGGIAAWQDGAWAFYTPREGWRAWVADEDKLYVWNGSAWGEMTMGAGAGASTWGVNATADTTNRLAVGSAASLFDNVGNGHQLKINKAAAADTASTLYQTGYSGRAEFGLAGDDDFHVKVSADGSAWTEAIVVDRTTGAARFPSTAYLDLPAGSAPATPASGKVRLYAKTDKSLYQKDDAGTEMGLAGIGGGDAASSVGLHNGKIAESHASNAATFALKTLAGSDPSAGDPVTAIFPDGSSVSITSALSLTIPSTATMGFTSGAVGRIWVGLANDSGTPRLGLRNCKASASIVGFPANGLLSSTAIGTGADNEQVTYTGSAVTDKPYILCAYAQWDSGLTTAGTWDASPTRIVQYGPHIPRPGTPVGNYKTAVNSGETSASDATPVQTNSTVSITPTDKANGIRVGARGTMRTTDAGVIVAARISRGASPTLIGSVANLYGGATGFAAVYGGGALGALDFPDTTGAQAYYVYLWQQLGSVSNAATWLPNAASSTSHMEAEEIMA